MLRSAKDVVKHAKDVAKHTEDIASITRTLPSMPKHALGTHNKRALLACLSMP